MRSNALPERGVDNSIKSLFLVPIPSSSPPLTGHDKIRFDKGLLFYMVTTIIVIVKGKVNQMTTSPLFDSSNFITLRIQHWIENRQGIWNMVCKVWNEHCDENLAVESFADALNTTFILLWAKDGRYDIPAHVIHNDAIEEVEGIIVDEGGNTGDLIDWDQLATRWISYAFSNTKPERGWEV
tara:strand:- start:451 stop:996 length:546 start_codon:yes stop_codon:yes gene_type:complete